MAPIPGSRKRYRQRTSSALSALATPAQRKARAVDLGSLKPTHQTTAGKRRLSGEQAYLRRTTDSSRARVAKRYGLSAGQVAALNRKAGAADRSLPKPVTGPTRPKPPTPSGALGPPTTRGSTTASYAKVSPSGGNAAETRRRRRARRGRRIPYRHDNSFQRA